jgi:hypothetical protein
MKGNKAMRRAMETKDFIRVNGGVPLIVDTTELITPTLAQEMLEHNKANRPVNWKKVEEYADIMSKGEWKLHSQGIVFDSCGNLLTGQKRLWAIVYSGVSILMRVSRGCPADTVRIMDRGEAQSARDLAARETTRKHSPYEVSLARGVLILQGINKPSKDQLADVLIEKSEIFSTILSETKGTKKTRSVLMILAAMGFLSSDKMKAKSMSRHVEKCSSELDLALLPGCAEKCWGKGAAFSVAMGQAQRISTNVM